MTVSRTIDLVAERAKRASKLGWPKDARHWIDLSAARRVIPAPRGWTKAAAAVAEVLFSDGDTRPPEQRLAWLAKELEDYVDRIGFQSRTIIRASTFAVDMLGPLLVAKLPPFSEQPFDVRAEALERLERTPLGLATFALKAILCILYFEHPDAASEVGFDGRPMKRGQG